MKICMFTVCSRNVPIMLKKYAYYAQEMCLLCSINMSIMLKKCAYYAQEMCLLHSRSMHVVVKKCDYLQCKHFPGHSISWIKLSRE